MDRQPEHHLCDLCKTLSIESLGSSRANHVLSIDPVKTKPCVLCTSLSKERWLQGREFSLFLKPTTYSGFVMRGSIPSRFSNIGVVYEGNPMPYVEYPLFTDENDPAIAAGVRVRRRPDLPSTPGTYETARAWIKECSSDHGCASGSFSAGTSMVQTRPHRLIDLQAFPKDSPDVRIVNALEMNVAYATLSYCWGKDMPQGSTTTLGNIHEREECLKPSELPQTLRDAIKVTRWLDIRYLWIDALCIIQDSLEDWQIESAKMASVYGNGLISISVDLSTSCVEGFLVPKPGEQNICYNHTVKISNTLSTGESSNLYVWIRDICGCFIKDGIDSLQRTVLSTRGWTYQEKFLAPRILHFIGSQVLWECREKYGIPLESGMELKEMQIQHKTQTLFGSLADSLLNPNFRPEKGELVENYWYEKVVPEYSKRALTNGNDKLPAIGGIAKTFAQRLGYKYIAGLWLEDLVYGLFWGTKDGASFPLEYRAPSWSWSSLDGEIMWCGDKLARQVYVDHVKVEEYKIDLVGADPFGRISGGWLRISGFIGQGTVSGNQLVCHKSQDNLGKPYLDVSIGPDGLEGRSLTYVVLSTLVIPRGAWEALHGLILRPKRETIDSLTPEYERIGYLLREDTGLHVDLAWLETNCAKTSFKLY